MNFNHGYQFRLHTWWTISMIHRRWKLADREYTVEKKTKRFECKNSQRSQVISECARFKRVRSVTKLSWRITADNTGKGFFMKYVLNFQRISRIRFLFRAFEPAAFLVAPALNLWFLLRLFLTPDFSKKKLELFNRIPTRLVFCIRVESRIESSREKVPSQAKSASQVESSQNPAF